MEDKKSKKIFIVIGAIVLILIIGLYLYVHNVHIHLKPDDGIYYCKYKGANFYVCFDNGELYTIMSDEYCTMFGKNTYNYTGEKWKKLVGSLYFSDDRILSLTNVPEGSHPAYITMTCVKSYTVDMDDEGKLKEDKQSEGETTNSIIYFYDDRIDFDGMLMNKVDDIDPVLKEMVRLFIDYQSGK